MLSKNTLKYLTSLRQKKYRDREAVFIAEGPKLIADLHAAGMELRQVFSSDEAVLSHLEPQLISSKDLKKISNQKTPNTAFAVFAKKPEQDFKESGLILVLDGIQDPGNLGTIIRLSDWFGVSALLCSGDTVDCYNPKVVQASMGGLSRVAIHYKSDLASWLKQSKLPIYGGFMEGQNVYEQVLPADAVLVMGNEGQGISDEVSGAIQTRLSIPNFGNNQGESLNVATASAVLLSEFKRSIGR